MSRFGTNIVGQNEITIGGNAGYKVEYTGSFDYSFVILTIANGKLYELRYDEEQLRVPETLPLANKMVESFKIL